jgi:hypothetical protein
MTRGLLDGLNDPELMARIAERQRIAERVAEQMGCTLAEARQHMSYWDQVAIETFCVGNDVPMQERH